MKKIFISLGLFISTVIFLMGFIDKNPLKPVESVADIVYSVNNIPKNLDKVGSLSKREQDIVCAVSRGLVELDEDGELIPALAESVDIRENGIEYDFKIRDDVYWSDGKKITASDIVQFLKETIAIESEENIKPLLNIFGVKEYRDSSESFRGKVAITDSGNNLIIRLNIKDENFLRELTKPQYRLRKSVILWEDIQYNYTAIPYSGDYSISDVTASEEIVLIRNKKTDETLVKTIHVVKDSNEDLALASFEVGNRDIVINPPKSELNRLNKEGKLINIPSNRGVYLSFNNNNNLNIEQRKEIYSLLIKALNEYESTNSDLIKLAEGSYFRNEDEDLLKLQARKVMSNNVEDVELPEVLYLACLENVLNKELVDYLSVWFGNNTSVTLVTTLLRSDENDNIAHYDMSLINLNTDYNEKEEFFNVISSSLNEDFTNKISTININKIDGELIEQIEENLFNNYLILPLIFYNDNIALNDNIENVQLDGNDNLIFEMRKK